MLVTLSLAATIAINEPSGSAVPIVDTWPHPRRVDPTALRHGPARSHAGDAGDRGAAGGVDFVSVDDAPEGDMPRDLAWTPDGTEIAIVHRDTDDVTFFETAGNTPTHVVGVGDFPVDVVITPDGRLAVVPNVLDHTVTLIDVATHAVTATIPVTGEQPFRVVITPDSTYAVVGVINDGVASAFSIIDLDLQIETATFPSGPQGVIGFFFTPEAGIVGNIFTAFALTPDGATIVLPDRGNARVRLYDRATGAETADLATATFPTAVDTSGDGQLAVVSHESGAQAVTVIDVPGRTVLRTLTTGDNLFAQVIRLTPDATHVMAAISNNVIFHDLLTGARTATISTGTVGAIELSFDGVYAFVSNFNARVIDVASQSLVRTISFGPCVDAATSPVARRAVALNNRFRENVHFYDIDGAGGFLESWGPSGSPPEGDSTHAVDVSADGNIVVAVNVVSANAAVIDVPTRTVRSYIDVGDRPKEVRLTPDGAYAVVCAMDANRVVIIDLATDMVVAELTISNRPGRVRIAPDGGEAYVLNVAGTDRISFIDLDGANSAIVAQLPAGQTGSANGPTYTETSGIELSPDGAVLAVCDSFNDLLRLYDTAGRAQVAAVPVGDFPLRVAFSPDGTRACVANHFSDSVTIVRVDGAQSEPLATVSGVARYPLTVSVDETGAYAYVGTLSSGGGANAVRVIDIGAGVIVRTIALADGSPRDSAIVGSVLHVMTTGGALLRFDAAGPDTALIDTTALSAGPADMAMNPTATMIAFAQPIPDGVDILSRASETICPDDAGDFLRQFGGTVSGDALDLCASDDVRLEVLQSARLSPLLPFIRLEFWAHSTFADMPVTSVEYAIEGHVSALVAGGQNPDTLRTSIRNYDPGSWELIDQRGTASSTDEIITHTQTTNAPDYVNAGDGEVRVRQEAWDPGLVFTPNWFLKVDLYEVTVGQ